MATVYTSWGGTCSENVTVYSGVMGSSVFSDVGGASNYLCLPETTEYNEPNPDALDPGSGTVAAVTFTNTTQVLVCSVC